MFEKIKAAFSSSTSQVSALFEDLLKADPQLGAAVVQFVVSGANPGVLMTPSLPQFVQSQCWSYWAKPVEELLIQNPSRLPSDMWVRLGHVYSLSSKIEELRKPWTNLPAWYFAIHVMRIRIHKQASMIDFDWVNEILEAAQVPSQHHPIIVLEGFFASLVGFFPWASPIDTWKTNRDTPKAQAMASFVYSQIALVPQILKGKSAEIKTLAAQWLALYPALLPYLAPMIDEWLVDSAKTVRQASIDLVSVIPEPLRSQILGSALARGTTTTVGTVVDFCARSGEPGRLLLHGTLSLQPAGKKAEMLTNALDRSQITAQAPVMSLEIPPPPPLDRTPLGREFTQKLEEDIVRWRESLERDLAKNPTAKYTRNALRSAQTMNRGYCEAVTAGLNGMGHLPDVLPENVLRNTRMPLLPALRYIMKVKNKRGSIPSYWVKAIAGVDYDLRSLAQAMSETGVENPIDEVSSIIFEWGGSDGRQPEQIWPFFAENPGRLQEALGMVATPTKIQRRWGPSEIDAALKILGKFPVVPNQFHPVLAQLATADTKTYRRTAQELLETLPGAIEIAAKTLSDSKGEVRAVGAAWIARIGDPRGVEPLKAALAKEKREQPQAAMLNALSVLGEDISSHLKPGLLQAAAKKGMAARKPAGMGWFPLEGLPSCRWADGTPVDPMVIQWWVVLSVKLKDPLGGGLIPMYVSLLDERSQEELGVFVLDSWISRDTLVASDQECRDYAQANMESKFAQYQQWAKYSPAYAAKTREDAFEELRSQKMGEYLGSATNEKGLLALTVGAPGYHVASSCTRYIRDHGRRRSQVESLITAASGNDDPAAIQLVLSVARKYKQDTVRFKAMELSEAIAERRGWSLDELADRTIPTAGFDDDGLLILDYGPRRFTGRIGRSPKTGAFAINLFNAEGKTVSSLPKPGVNDDDELASETRKQLTVSRKELGQIVTLQTSRLFEAMCLERTWDLPTWTECLFQHPVMSHLVSTLVWKATDGENTWILRPTVEGELLNADDEVITLPPTARIGMAHVATLSNEDTNQWRGILNDYDIDQLFSQLEATPPPEVHDGKEISDHRGWLSDSFAIRGRATKRGYTRAPVEDGAWFSSYIKSLTGAGIVVMVYFTGSYVPEEQIQAAVTDLVFAKGGFPLPLNKVPPILLWESYADYVFIAEAGSYTPDWESKSYF